MSLQSALPHSFAFYQLGQVELQPAAPPVANAESDWRAEDAVTGRAACAFTLHGGRSYLLLVAFDASLDASTYAELGNILASRLATELAALPENGGGLVAVSPPRALSETQARALLRSRRPLLWRTYLHSFGTQRIPVDALIFETPSKPPLAETGHA